MYSVSFSPLIRIILESMLFTKSYALFENSEDIIDVSITKNTVSSSGKIPLWIRTNANWGADGLITDSDFVKGIEYLANSGIIQVK